MWQKEHKNIKTGFMKFINYLTKITGVDIYAMSSFLIFFTFFIIVAIWALKADKKLINTLSNMPLDNPEN
ncbi:hypothetical protein SAE01_46660 [Segetibacter aerophilus]|uniref:CcoQ/FixQ family Cbb3-type cytochrome c oxidase assembly chaperone n=2 Tax=Segetibacter aerophilus TaxID=670293 RepID=A0A512BJM2_9BACT|nr:hypothetical protein SAE01_46660 [Segetibacter aerophilus]